MPEFPQYYGAKLVEYGTVVTKATGYTASSGDIVICNGTTAGTFAIVLPAVALGGPVTVANCSGTTTGGTVTVVTADSSTIDGITGATGVTLLTLGTNSSTAATVANQSTRNTFVSDGTSWYRVF
jgi:hypothetical protein